MPSDHPRSAGEATVERVLAEGIAAAQRFPDLLLVPVDVRGPGDDEVERVPRVPGVDLGDLYAICSGANFTRLALSGGGGGRPDSQMY